MTTVRWLGSVTGLGETYTECLDDKDNQSKCLKLAAAAVIATGTELVAPLTVNFVYDNCMEYLCSTGKMPTMQQLPVPKGTSSTTPPASSEAFPLGVYSDETKALQQSLNQKLGKDGYCLLNPDGKLGASTCGAAKHYGSAPPTCQSFTSPKKCGGAATAPTPEALPPVATSGVDSSGLSGWQVAGLLALGVGGVVWLASRSKALDD